MKRRKIVVVGSSNTDMVVRVSRLPSPGETVLGSRFDVVAGGKGANQAVAAARAGGRVSFIGRVGHDAFGERAVEGLIAHGIDVKGIVRDPQSPSGVALIVVSQEGENSIAVAPGANGRLTSRDVERCTKIFSGAAVVLLQLETPLASVSTAARLARASGAQIILNPAPAAKLPLSLLKNVSILTPNESEAERLTGIRVTDDRSARRAAHRLHAMGVESIVLTLGQRGAFVYSPSLIARVPGFRVEAIDTTAAGDVFNGALAVGLAEGKSLRAAIRFAHAAAALSVTKRGAQPSAPSRTQILRMISASPRGSARR